MKSPQTDLTFIHSPAHDPLVDYGAQFVPLWACQLAAYLPDSISASLHDLRLEKICAVPRAKIFAFSGINQDYSSLMRAWEFLKNKYPDSAFIIGGPITWSFEKAGQLEKLFCFDHIFILDGEETLPAFLGAWRQGKRQGLPKIIRGKGFALEHSKPARLDLIRQRAKKYYGGIVEVSRGCPFLCEFCDIRVLPGNNRTRPRDIESLVTELQSYHEMEIHRIQLCCDNFIGDSKWANNCVDKILEWKEHSSASTVFWTWLTIDIAKKPELMKKMRQAGFEMLFIGIESFHSNSILETAKVQNLKTQDEITATIRQIQSYGFIIVPGLIFGFDSDPPDIFQKMAAGLRDSGLLGGDPSFLVALPGTPLHHRMKATERLVPEKNEATDNCITRAKKICSNIKYLQDKRFLRQGFQDFIKQITSPQFTFERLKNYVESVRQNKNYVPNKNPSFLSVRSGIATQFCTPGFAKIFFRRISLFLHPPRFCTILKAWFYIQKNKRQFAGIEKQFYFLLFTWSNLLLKYQNLKQSDFEISSIDGNYDFSTLWKYVDDMGHSKNLDGPKTLIQQRKTREALVSLQKNLQGKRSVGEGQGGVTAQLPFL